MISLTVSHRIAHHALKAVWPVLVGGLLIPTYHQPWWIKGLAMIPIFLGIMAAMVAIVGHRPEECPLCEARPRERLNRLHYRAWRAYGRYGWAFLTLVVAVWIVIVPFNEGLVRHDSQTLPAEAFWTGLITLGVMYVMARRFAALNYGFARPRPIQHFVQEYCTPLMHRSQNLIIGAMVVTLVTRGAMPHRGPWSLFVVMGSLLLVAAVYLNLRHGASLCETCVDRAEIPVNAAEQAARNRWRFTLMHKSYPVMPLGVVVIVAAPHWLSNLGEVVVQGAFDAVLVASMLLVNYHNAFQPWCPYCGGDDGGGQDETVLDPEPDQGRPVPV